MAQGCEARVTLGHRPQIISNRNVVTAIPFHHAPPSAAAGGFDFGDVDFSHVHHRGEDASGFSAAGGQRVQQHARRDLPGDVPAVFAPAAPLCYWEAWRHGKVTSGITGRVRTQNHSMDFRRSC